MNNVIDIRTRKPLVLEPSTSSLDFLTEFRFIDSEGTEWFHTTSKKRLLDEAVMLDAINVQGRMQQKCISHFPGTSMKILWIDLLDD